MFKSMKRIIRWAGKYRGRLYLGSVFSFFSSLSTAIPTMAAAYALDKSIQAYWAHTTIDASLIYCVEFPVFLSTGNFAGKYRL